MDTDRVAVATMTWARSPAEEGLLRRSLGLLARLGLPVAVADRGTNPGFAEFLRTVPGFSMRISSTEGLVAQVQAGFDAAARFDRPFILYVEPDKELFFERQLSDFLRQAPDTGDVGVVLASRSAASLRTFPAVQRYTEGVINHLCGELLGPAGDYSYGPFLMNRGLLPYIANLHPRLGWGWRHFMFRAASREGLSVLHAVGDYPCPPGQRCEDEAERRHRMRQLSENILGLIE
jgi:hypothetical protein